MNKKIVAKDCHGIKEELTKVVIADGVTAIGNNAYAGCEKLKQVFIPDSITFIEASAFDGSGALLKIPNENGYILNRTIMIFCNENSYADTWFKSKKTGYIVVNSSKMKDKHGPEN